MAMKPLLSVVGAAIVRGGKVLALRRSTGIDSVIHKFEFVGGKVENGETPEAALARECREELSLEIEVGERLNTIEYEYPEFTVALSVYFVKPLSDYTVHIHEEERWINCAELVYEEWAPADREFLRILKNGFIRTVEAKTDADFVSVRTIADVVMHSAFGKNTAEGQVDYMLDKYLSTAAIRRNIEDKHYKYVLVYLNSEAAGFYAYCPAENFDSANTTGTYLSGMYLLNFARGKQIASKIFATLRRPVYLTVNRNNAKAVNVYKHCGFRIVQSVTNDIGGGYVSEDFNMVLGK